MEIDITSRRYRLAAALAVALGLSMGPHPLAYAACAPTWVEGATFTAGTQVTYNGTTYQALVTHTAWKGAGWNPAQTPSLWKSVGLADCGTTGGGSTGGDTGGGTTDDGTTDGGTGGGHGTVTGETKFIPYFYSWAVDNPAYWVNDVSKLPAGVNHVVLAFALARGDTLELQADNPARLKQQIAAAKAKGMKVGVSTGGATAGYINDMSGTPASIAQKFVTFINSYGFDFIDVDFEGSYVENPSAASRMADIMKEVRKRLTAHPITLTVPSYGGDYGLSNSVIEMAKKMYAGNALTAVTAMSFDYYGLNKDVYQAAKRSVGLIAKNVTGECKLTTAEECADRFDTLPQSRRMYGIISMIGVADDGNLTSVEEQARQARFAKDNGLYSIGFWAINRDQGNHCSGGLALCTNTNSAAGAYTLATVNALGAGGGSTGGGGTGGGNTGGGTGGGSTDGGGTCTSSVAAWSAATVYTGGKRVSYNGQIYEAKWWTQGENPVSQTSGVWKVVGTDSCGGGTTGGGSTGGGSTGGTGGVDTTGWPKPLQGNNVAYNNNGNHVVASYFAEWGVYGRNFHVENIPAANLTHLLYGFIPICGPNESLRAANPEGYSALQSQCAGKPNYSVTIHDKFAALEKSYPGDKWDDPIRGNFGQMRKMKASNPNIKILPSVGGWTLSDPFYSMANNAGNRATFVNSVVSFLRTYDFFDGVDIDWEYPGGGGANAALGSTADRQGYATLMRDLRAALNTLGTEKGRKYLLTSAVGSAPAKIAAVNYATAAGYMDYVFAMTYDYYGAWDNNLGHHAGLNAGLHEINAGFNANDTIQNLMRAGVPGNKLVLGVAMYGRGWKGVTGAAGNDPFYGKGNGAISGTWEAGVLDYKAIESLYLGGASGSGINGFSYRYDTQAEAPYLWRASTGELISFENARSARAKGRYAQSNGLAGVFSWEIDADNGNILNAMHEGLGHTRK